MSNVVRLFCVADTKEKGNTTDHKVKEELLVGFHTVKAYCVYCASWLGNTRLTGSFLLQNVLLKQ